MKNFDGKYLLVGLMKCPMCGATMVSYRTVNKLKDGTKKVIRYYYCGAFRSKGSAVCKSKSIRADYAESFVIDRMKQVVNHPSVLKEIVAATNKKKKESIKPLQNELKSINSLIDDIEGRRNKYLKLYENNLIEQDMIIDRINEIREERDSLLKRKAEIEEELGSNSSQKLDETYLRNVLKKFTQLLSMATFEQQKMLLQLIIKEIKVGLAKLIDCIALQKSKPLQNEIIHEALSDDESDRAFTICLDV